jgi:tetratricopeptide (TPR) repeat protein
MLLLLIWWKRGRIQALDVWTLGPWLVIGTGLGLVTAWLEKSHNQAGADWSLSLIQRCLLAGRVPWFYAGKLAWPYPLIFVYPRWDIDPHIWWQYLFPIATAGVFFFLWLARRRLGRAPLVAVLIFIVTLFPALGFVDVYPFRYSFVADHFQYLASMSLIALAAAGTTAISQNRVTLMSVVVTVLGALTWQHCLAFHDAETLWRDTLAKNPGCWMAQNNLGLTLVQTGRETEAIEHWMEALRIKPDYAEPHYNLGDALAQAGNTSGAIQQWKQALRFKPDFIEAHQNLGNALRLAGRGTEAVREYGEALRINPKNADTHYNLGLALADQGRSAEAIDQFHLALDVANAQDNIALASIIQVRLKLYETNSLNRQMR